VRKAAPLMSLSSAIAAPPPGTSVRGRGLAARPHAAGWLARFLSVTQALMS
jgi:hypothetical protein